MTLASTPLPEAESHEVSAQEIQRNLPVTSDQILSSLTAHLQKVLGRVTKDDNACVNLIFYNRRLHATLHFMPSTLDRRVAIDTGGYHAQLRQILKKNDYPFLAPRDINSILAYACASPQAVSAARKLMGTMPDWDSPQDVLEDLLHRFNSHDEARVLDLQPRLHDVVNCLLSFLPQPRGLKLSMFDRVKKGPKHITWIPSEYKLAQWKEAATNRSIPYRMYFLLSMIESLQWPAGASFALLPNIHKYLEDEAPHIEIADKALLEHIQELQDLEGLTDDAYNELAATAEHIELLLERGRVGLGPILAFYTLPLRCCGLYFSYESSSKTEEEIRSDLRDTLPHALAQHAAELSQVASVVALESAMPPKGTANVDTLAANRFIARGLTSLLPASQVHVLYSDDRGIQCEVSQRPSDRAVETRLKKDELPAFCLPTHERPWGAFSPPVLAGLADGRLTEASYTECHISQDTGLIVGEKFLGEMKGGVCVTPPQRRTVWNELGNGNGRVYLGQFVAALHSRVSPGCGASAASDDREEAVADWYRTFSWTRFSRSDASRRAALIGKDAGTHDRRYEFYRSKMEIYVCGKAPAPELRIGDFGGGFSDICQHLKQDDLFNRSQFVNVVLERAISKPAEASARASGQWDWGTWSYTGPPLDVIFLGFGRFGVHWRQDASNAQMLRALLDSLSYPSGLLVIEHMHPSLGPVALPLNGIAGADVVESWENGTCEHGSLWKAKFQYHHSDDSQHTEFCRFANYDPDWYAREAGRDAMVTACVDYGYEALPSGKTLSLLIRRAAPENVSVAMIANAQRIVHDAKKAEWPPDAKPPTEEEVSSWATRNRLPAFCQIPTLCELRYLSTTAHSQALDAHRRVALGIVDRWSQSMKLAGRKG